MKLICLCLFTLALTPYSYCAPNAPEPYINIDMTPIFEGYIVRDAKDRTYSGQIKSHSGIIKFKDLYAIKLSLNDFDFNNQILIYGITDQVTTRAVEFLHQKKANIFTLNYADTGMRIDFSPLEKTQKRSYLQIFAVKKHSINHINVKNVIQEGLSIVYE